MIAKNTKIGDLDWEVRGKRCPVIYIEQGKTSSWIYGEYDVVNAAEDFYTTGLLFGGNRHYLFPWECFVSRASIWINQHDNSIYRNN